MIDTHAHLTALDDPDEAVQRAAGPGVTRILTVGTDVEDGRRALELTERHEGVFAILGIHPHEAGTATAEDLDALRDLLTHPKAVAVGESGLDWYRDYAPRDDQRRLFAAELELAAELGKPAVIHHTGPSAFLPDAAGLFRFRTLEEAARMLDAVEADYEHQCSLARKLAEEYFDARKVVGSVLERALG